MDSNYWKNREQFPKFLGFYLSPLERVIHSIVIFILGSFIASYKNMDVYNQSVDNMSHPISNWYILPFVYLSYFMVWRVITPKFINKLTIKARESKKFSDFILPITIQFFYYFTIFILVEILYVLLMVFFMSHLWCK